MNKTDRDDFVMKDQINPTQYDTFAYSPSIINVFQPEVRLNNGH
jgi:hypothetical protein